MRRALFAIVFLACSSGSSGDNKGGSSADVVFHGEIDALPDFKGDTGLVPPDSPVQVQFTLSAGGKITADAKAVGSGSDDAPVLTAVPGSGKLALDLHFKFVGTIKEHLTGVPPYDGPIPGIDGIDIPIGGVATFDPFLLGGGKASIQAPIPETMLPPIPLGTVPGKLVLTVMKESTISVELTGLCASVSKGPSKARFVGQITVAGTLVIKPSIEIALPIGPKKTIDIAPMNIPIPPSSRVLDLGTQPVAHSGMAPQGQMAMVGSCDGVMAMPPPMDSGMPPMDGGTTMMDGDTDATDPDGGMCTLGIDYGTQVCTSCMQAQCCDKDNACSTSTDCMDLLLCVDSCMDKTCADACRTKYPVGSPIVDDLIGCMLGSCKTDCQ